MFLAKDSRFVNDNCISEQGIFLGIFYYWDLDPHLPTYLRNTGTYEHTLTGQGDCNIKLSVSFLSVFKIVLNPYFRNVLVDPYQKGLLNQKFSHSLSSVTIILTYVGMFHLNSRTKRNVWPSLSSNKKWVRSRKNRRVFLGNRFMYSTYHSTFRV